MTNTRYFFDTEFNGFGGALLSAAIVREDGEMLYFIDEEQCALLLVNHAMDAWVETNVLPILHSQPVEVTAIIAPARGWGPLISNFIYRPREVPQVFADWMSDIADLMNLFITGPGTAVPMGHITNLTCLRHLDVYPTDLPGAIQHNAAWDALALKRWIEQHEVD